MDQRTIDRALEHASTTKDILIGTPVFPRLPALLRQHFGQEAAVIVADENTYRAAGQALQQDLESAGLSVHEPLVLPGRPTLHADYARVLQVEEFLKTRDAVPIAVGSGTVNDLVKLSSHRLGRKYMVVGTAASMDGYTSFGASITQDGFKDTHPCDAPQAVVADLDVLAQAPAEMNAWGYADLIGKVSAGADWIIADAVGAEPIHELAWHTIQDPLREAVANPHLLPQGNPQALANVFGGLVLSGLAMQVHRSSRPASGSEHMFSHLWQMQGIHTPQGGEASHGTKVGVGTLASLALYEKLMAVNLQTLDVDQVLEFWPSFDRVQAKIRASLDVPEIIETAVELNRRKYLTPQQLAPRLEHIKNEWPQIKTRLEAQLLSPHRVQQMIEASGGVTSPRQIGLTGARLKRSYSLARMIRSRYTLFDFLAETGFSRQLTEALFAPGGYWSNLG